MCKVSSSYEWTVTKEYKCGCHLHRVTFRNKETFPDRSLFYCLLGKEITKQWLNLWSIMGAQNQLYVLACLENSWRIPVRFICVFSFYDHIVWEDMCKYIYIHANLSEEPRWAFQVVVKKRSLRCFHDLSNYIMYM